MKKRFLILICTFFFVFAASAVDKASIKEGAILHCWCWSFKTIEENLPQIAAAGFTAVQTSPINECLVGDNGGMELMSKDQGKWYYHYQPTDWKIGNYQLGTRDDFISMCKKADEYNIGVIVDVLPNHTTPQKVAVSKDFVEACGGWEKLYHANGENDIRNYSDRYQCTTGKMGGLPDVNTENPLFQSYFMNFMNDAIDCGADGFRFDTAKHIGLPDDPLDAASKENDFWPVFTGKKDINGVYLHNAENLFLYGEVLQGSNSREKDYSEFIGVTASAYGFSLRSSVKTGMLTFLENWNNPAGKDRIVTWIESHDTYANEGESAKMTNFQLRCGWAIIAARDGGTPLFFNRPKGAEGVQFPGASKIGDSGNDEYKHPEVAAVNNFRTAMKGESENLFNYDDDMNILCIERGNKGLVIINQKKAAITLKMEVSLPDGKYIDKANKLKFTVKNGILSGKMPKDKIAVIY